MGKYDPRGKHLALITKIVSSVPLAAVLYRLSCIVGQNCKALFDRIPVLVRYSPVIGV